MSVQTGSVTNGDILLNGIDIAGRVLEFDFGDFSYEEVEHKTLGTIGVIKLPSRSIEAIEQTIKYEYLEPALKRELMNPRKTHKLQIHQYVDVSGPDGLDLEASHMLVTHIGFRVIKTKRGSAKLGENVELEQTISVTSFIENVYGEELPILEYDFFAKIHKINGKDVWPT